MFEKRKRQDQLIVLGALYEADPPGGPIASYELLKITGLGGGRMYTALATLQNKGSVRQALMKSNNLRPARGWRLTPEEEQ
jgi:hypothetical protein